MINFKYTKTSTLKEMVFVKFLKMPSWEAWVAWVAISLIKVGCAAEVL